MGRFDRMGGLGWSGSLPDMTKLFRFLLTYEQILYWATTVGSYGFTYTVPTVIVELGYTAANAV
jgi:hypothetical protein